MPEAPIPNPQPPTPQPRPNRTVADTSTPSPGDVRAEASAADTPASISLGVPREIGAFTIQRVIGSGGMATVYAALQKQPRRTVALKVMKAGISPSRSEAALRRFKREIEILGRLHHPYIAAVYDAGTFDDPGGNGPTPYFVMEYIAGAMNILEYITRKDLDVRERLKLFVKVCAAVEHGHSQKVIHRDLKPGNILIDQYGEPKIIDFGIAHAAELDISQQTMQTEAGRLVGTLQYMAPEQVDTRPQDLDGRCDVYALGVLLYKMMTGRPPYDLEALPVFEALRIIREETPRRPSEIKPEIKGDLETIILKAMEHERGRRYRNAGSLGRDVVRFLANKPINARRAGLVYRATLFAKRNAAVLSVFGIIALIASGAVGYIVWERSRAREETAQKIQQREEDLQRQREQIEARAAAATQAAASATPVRAEPFTLREHTARIAAMRFLPPDPQHPAGRLISASHDHTLLVWDLASREVLHRADAVDGPVTHLAASRDGSLIAAASDAGDAITLMHGDATVVRTIRAAGGVRSLAVSPHGNALAWGADNLTLNVMPLDPREPRASAGAARSVRSSSGAFTHLAFDASGENIAAASDGGPVYFWKWRAEPPDLKRMTGPASAAAAVGITLSGHESAVLWLGENGAGWLFAIDRLGWRGSGQTLASSPIIATAFSANATRLTIATSDGVHIWNVSDPNERPARRAASVRSEEPPSAVAMDDEGAWIALGTIDGDVRVEPASP
jgi:WD40 repeat protein